MSANFNHVEAAVAMAGTGLLIGMGQLLASEERLTPRIIFGRAFSSSGLALVAGTLLIQVPEIPLLALIGLSALIASLGTSFLEKFLNNYFGGYKS